MAQKVVENVGRLADTTSADAGYFSEEAIESESLAGTNLLVPPNRQKHGAGNDAASEEKIGQASDAKTLMRERLQTEEGKALYKMRKAIVEPVFGQVKSVRGFTRFSLRGFDNARFEWLLIALTHNLLKLFRYGKGASIQTPAAY